MRTYKNQHPYKKFNENYINLLKALGFEDISWKNDTAASFYYIHPSTGMVLIAWVDDMNRNARETEDMDQFGLEVYESEDAYQERANTISDFDINIGYEHSGQMIEVITNLINSPEATLKALRPVEVLESDHYMMWEMIACLLENYKASEDYWGSGEEIATNNLLFAYAEKCGVWTEEDTHKNSRSTPEERLKALRHNLVTAKRIKG